MRAALGAGRARIVRQLLTESMVLALAAGAAGMLLTGIALSLFRFVASADLPGLARIGFDWRVGAFAAALSVATGFAFGVVPAWRGRPDAPAGRCGGLACEKPLRFDRAQSGFFDSADFHIEDQPERFVLREPGGVRGIL
jgi:hypothetical protein